MRKDITLTPNERKTLGSLAKSPLELVRAKALSIIMYTKGSDIEYIADVQERSPRCIRQWLASYRTDGIGSVVCAKVGNLNAAKLTPQQKAEVKAALTPDESNASALNLWSVPKLKEYISSEFGVEYSTSGIHTILKYCNLSFKYPETQINRRDDEAIVARMQEVHKEVEDLTASGYTVYTQDEVRACLVAEIRKAWLPRGETWVVSVETRRLSRSYAGFLNMQDGTVTLHTFEGNQKTDTFIPIITKFLDERKDKKVAIVWDNAPWHTSKATKEALRPYIESGVKFVHLPTYAPEYNPIEHVWGAAKAHIANVQYEKLEDLCDTFEGYALSQTKCTSALT